MEASVPSMLKRHKCRAQQPIRITRFAERRASAGLGNPAYRRRVSSVAQHLVGPVPRPGVATNCQESSRSPKSGSFPKPGGFPDRPSNEAWQFSSRSTKPRLAGWEMRRNVIVCSSSMETSNSQPADRRSSFRTVVGRTTWHFWESTEGMAGILTLDVPEPTSRKLRLGDGSESRMDSPTGRAYQPRP